MKLISDTEKKELTDLFNQDVVNETKYLQNIGQYDTGVDNELALMVKVYNEQLDQLVRLRFDAEIHRAIFRLETSNKELEDNVKKADKSLAIRRMALLIIRAQIEDMVKLKTNA